MNYSGADAEVVEKLLRPSSEAIPVLGAGVSQGAGLPGSRDLGAHLLEVFSLSAEYQGDVGALAKVADLLWQHGLEGELGPTIVSYVCSWPERTSALIETLIRVRSRFVATFNYDPTVERAVEARNERVESLGNSPGELERAVEILRARHPPDLFTVLHMHGRAFEGNDEIVIGGSGYRRNRNTMLENVIRELALQKRLFFLGTSLDETYFVNQLEEVTVPERRPHHLFFCLGDEQVALTEGRAPILPGRTNIYMYPVGSYEELTQIAGRLVSADPPPAKAVVPPVSFDAESYVPIRLYDRRGPDPSDPDVLAAAILAEGDHVIPAIAEGELLNAPRTVVLGNPGTGKTEMLRNLASRVGLPRQAVLIRLADVEFAPGRGPQQNLCSWAREGSAFQGEVEIEPAALDQGRFHFFLDGLDEVTSGSQVEIAEQINECAAAFPQHSFTLASRPLPSLELLRVESPEASEWEQLALRPDEGWRERFLAAAGVSLEELYTEMPALEDLSEITTTPFYLANILALKLRGELHGLPDFGALLHTLVDSAIAREGEALALDHDEVRIWLQDVALAGTIAGRRTFSAEELRSFPLPEGSKSDQVRLARGLEQRLLLAEDAGAFRFHHRLLGEQLAAEALVNRGPLPELFDALVPFIDAELSGVRPDAAVPLALAALQSEAWRSALAKRDPLAAARATPEAVERSTAEASLTVLWENAVRRQIWAWERGMQLVDDADAMGRLLRAVTGCGIEKDILAAARGAGSEQDQGNAIRVLARAGHPQLEAILVAVLTASGQNGVVLRQAAIAIRDCRMVELIEPLVAMLTSESDHLVHQVGVSVLSELVEPERLLSVFTRLLTGPEASYAVVMALPSLGPGDSLCLLAAYLQAGHDPNDLTGRKRIEKLFSGLEVAELNTAELSAAVDVLIGFRLHTERAGEICARDPDLILGRLATLVSEYDHGWWEILDIAKHFDPERLLDAGLSTEVVERVEQRRRVEAERMQAVADGTVPEFVPLHGRNSEPDHERPGLSDLLSGASTDFELQGRCEELAPEVEDLAADRRSELLRRMEAWWPDKPFVETITVVGPSSWQQERGAHAWLWYGPKLRPTLDSQRWGELASCGVLWDEQSAWLRESQTVAGVYVALDLLGAESDPGRWDQFFSCCTDPLPNPVLFACASHLDTRLPEDAGHRRYNLRSLAERMLLNGRDDLARALAASSPDFYAILEPLLARDGDIDAQHRLLSDLDVRVREQRLPDDRDLAWLGGASSPALLPGLFLLLGDNWKLDDRPVARVRSGYGLHDLFNPLLEAIARIGGRGAVAGYDELISRGGDFRWLRASRERVAAAELLADGQRFSSGAAAALGLPTLAPDSQ